MTVAAPDANQSGSGVCIAFSGDLAVTRRAERVYFVVGSPLEATEFGLSVVSADNPPDLVVSGINSDQNVGAIVIRSGTVGAVVTALADGVPAIAISAEVDLGGGATPYPQSAEFLVDLIAELDAHSRGRALLPPGLGRAHRLAHRQYWWVFRSHRTPSAQLAREIPLKGTDAAWLRSTTTASGTGGLATGS